MIWILIVVGILCIRKFLHVVDSLCPVEKKSFSNDKPIWLTNNLMLLMKECDRCMPKKIC